MNLNLNTNQTRIAGAALITLALVMILNLWWLVPVALVGGAGVAVYRRERAFGRINSAIQGGLWGVGLAFLLLIGSIFPGVLLLAGGSLMLRGREVEADERVQRAIARIARRRAPASFTPPTTTSPRVTIVEEQPSDNATVRLR